MAGKLLAGPPGSNRSGNFGFWILEGALNEICIRESGIRSRVYIIFHLRVF
jgi:hypothetical protein